MSAQREGDEVAVKVSDNGIGIAKEHLEQIFKMFGQVPSVAKPSHGGLGIGLALAKRLVELHGGCLTAHSQGVGKGSQFIARLPAADGGDKAISTEPQASGLLPQCRVLVVDDLRDSADALAMLLQAMGHSTRTAYDGGEAIRIAEQFRPSVVFLDLGMPGLDGSEVCRRIRAQPRSTGMILAAQTGWGTEFDRRGTLAAGFDFHLVKPLEWGVIQDVLRRAATGTDADRRSLPRGTATA